MTIKLLKIVFLVLSLSIPAFAETNLAGEEIIILDDAPTSLSLTPASQPDPVLSYLPEQPPENTVPPVAEADKGVITDTDNLWQRIKKGYAMPELKSPYTATHEIWYASRPDYVKRMVERSGKYLYHIVEEVEKRGMPTEIALLPMVESAFNPQAYSRSRASGIWQFMPATGKNFGLDQTWWSDNRKDVTAATDAALTYLQRLHVMFGTWDLALAAYNAGEGTVQRAIERNRRKGLPTDYESLPLPPETKNYVPKLQAIKNIMTNPEQFGLDIQTIPNRPYFTKVTAPQQIDAHLAAQLAEISFDEFSSLNPEYNRPVIKASGSVHEILLPVSAAETFNNNLANYDKPLVSWQTYHAKRGERMESIARKFGIGLAQLRDVNDLPSRKNMGKSSSLLVPSNKKYAGQDETASNENLVDVSASSDELAAGTYDNDAEPAQVARVRHTVKRNESLQQIAKHYGTSTKQLMTLNHLKSNHIITGQKLLVTTGNKRLVSAAKPAERSDSKKTHYVVKRGDTLDSIARKFDVAMADLKRWNNISGSRIVPGHRLTVSRPDEA
jgi:membrane-bound lytic murein transglycosylase D